MSESLVVVTTFAYDWQAELARNLLEEADIHAVITDKNICRAFPPSGDSRGVKLQVWQRDLQEAKRMLEDALSAEEDGST